MKKVLITGGAGFIGSNLVKKLSSIGYDITIIDNLLEQVHGINGEFEKKLLESSRCIKSDISKIETWDLIKNQSFDSIIFLASETGTGQSMFKNHSYCHTNICSLSIMCDLIIDKKIKTNQVILSSSRSVYGDAILDENNNPIASKETDITKPLSTYATTKLTQELLLINSLKGIDIRILRFQNVYGPGQSLKNPYTGILSIFSNALINEKDIQIFDDGMMSRDFVYVDDVVDSIILSLETEEFLRDVFNVGSGNRTSVLDIANMLKKEIKSDSKIIVTGEKLNGDIRHNYANIDKIQKLGYVSKTKIEDGLKKFINWVVLQKNNYYNNYEETLELMRKNGVLKK